MRIALAQQNYMIGDFEGNRKKIIDAIRNAKNQSADIVVFSELCVCGYPPRDFLEFEDFILRCEESVKLIAKECEGIAAVIGAPSRNPVASGKDLFNSAYFLSDGKVQQVIHKTLLPTYDIFDEVRYFESNTEWKLVDFKGKKIAITICEDIWNVGANPLYVKTPMDELKKLNPDFVINISASPFDYQHQQERIALLKNLTNRYNLPVYYCNTVGAQTELIFDGGSLVVSANGNVFSEMKFFEEQLSVFNHDEVLKSNSESISRNEKTELIYDSLVLGIRDYFSKLNFKKAILGLSGGIDSAVVMCLAVKALGKENVLPVLLPSEFSSKHSVDDSVALCKTLGVAYENIPIATVFNEYLKSLEISFQGKPFDLAEENLQARIRAGILMALSNKHQYILLNTSNKSEAAVGYGTLYGDMCGGLSVIGDVYKTEVYELANYINREKEIIPKNIISKAPSAELRPNQKDSDSLPDYDVLDKILFQYIEKRKGPRELVEMGFEKNLVDRVLKLVNTNEYKRYQTPPILRVSPKAFGSGRRLPIVGKYLS
ncbi:MAG: NAD+ synthase [Bacteroidota bacterium]